MIETYNNILRTYLINNSTLSDPDTLKKYLSNLVDYVFMMHGGNLGLCYMVNSTYKDILNYAVIKRYL